MMLFTIWFYATYPIRRLICLLFGHSGNPYRLTRKRGDYILHGMRICRVCAEVEKVYMK